MTKQPHTHTKSSAMVRAFIIRKIKLIFLRKRNGWNNWNWSCMSLSMQLLQPSRYLLTQKGVSIFAWWQQQQQRPIRRLLCALPIQCTWIGVVLIFFSLLLHFFSDIAFWMMDFGVAYVHNIRLALSLSITYIVLNCFFSRRKKKWIKISCTVDSCQFMHNLKWE